LSFSPDGRRLAAASVPEELWGASLSFSPDGRRLAAAGVPVEIWDATPMTPELRARDDALRLIRFLLERVTSEAELRDRIAGDPTISKETRATALELARGFWTTRIRGQASRLVSSLFARLLLRADVLDAVRADRTLIPEVRAAALALALAETWPESPMALNNAAWELVKLPDRPHADFRRGLRLAETVCQLEPHNVAFLNTLGVAQYRAGQSEKALATLSRSNELNFNRDPADLAFLAMAQQRLGEVEAARQTLTRLRAVMKAPARGANTEDAAAFLHEAEALIELDPAFPADPFAP
jgi:hypothetical protein